MGSSRRRRVIGPAERALYACICSHDGIKAREIAREIGLSRKEVNQLTYRSPFVRDLCYHDDEYLWYGLIQQRVPHTGLREFSGWYGYVSEFCATDEQEWFDELVNGCQRIGRNLNDTRGLFHSIKAIYLTSSFNISHFFRLVN